ncbi:hypothetical protein [Kitasatospora sp. NPDC058190]|uniref:hypothetical protein n=1 Tax=Kitasatospora sp. NPDC058190 TaxID=3346371 RepID=UPI0036DB4229
MPLTPAAGAWDEAVRRATPLVASYEYGGMDENNWNHVAARDIIAVVLYALHLRDGVPVGDVQWRRVLWHVWDDRRVAALAEEALPAAGHDLFPLAELTGPADPVAQRWRWLTRTWEPLGWDGSVPALADGRAREPLWGGMSRNFAVMSPDPALELCADDAANAVQAHIAKEVKALRRFDRVEITGGEWKRNRGYVMVLAWALDDDQQITEGPIGYEVDLDNVDGDQRIWADDLRQCDDVRWPQRPKRTKKYLPRDTTLPPRPSCAEELEALLGRVANPAVLPERLREVLAVADGHYVVSLERQASPAPERLSWQVTCHVYEFEDDRDPVELFHIEVRTHVNDDPRHYLALDRGDVPSILAQVRAELG